jgi:hypothetical protein
VAEYNERKKEAIQEFREGGKDQEWLKDEVEGLVRELQSAIEPVRVAAVRLNNKKPPKGASKLRKPPRSSTCADGDGNQRGEHREDEGDGGGGMNVQQGKVKSRKGMMSLSVSSPCDNQATIVGPASAARYDALCNALDATSKASGSYTVNLPKPCTLDPKSDTLQPTTYNLQPTTYNLQPNLQPRSNTLHPIPYKS